MNQFINKNKCLKGHIFLTLWTLSYWLLEIPSFLEVFALYKQVSITRKSWQSNVNNSTIQKQKLTCVVIQDEYHQYVLFDHTSTYYLIGEKFVGKNYVGKNLRHLAKISSLFPDEFFPDKV